MSRFLKKASLVLFVVLTVVAVFYLFIAFFLNFISHDYAEVNMEDYYDSDEDF